MAKENSEKKQKKGNGLYKFLIIAVLVALVVSFLPFKEKTKGHLSYNKVMELVDKKEVKSISFNIGSDEMTVVLKNGDEVLSDNPRTETFKKEMLKKDVKVTTGGNLANNSAAVTTALLNIVIVCLLLLVAISFLRKGMSSKTAGIAITVDENKPKIKFKDIAGNDEVKEEMKTIVDFLKDSSKYKKMGIKPPSGALMTGPPGTGKTMMAKAIAGEAEVPFFYVSGSQFIEMFAGLGAKRVRDVFKKARQSSPCILFIDEVDAIGGNRNSANRTSENDQTLNALLEEMDGFNSNDEVVVIAATNRLNSLDPAFIRPGRFDKHLYVGLPDVKARKKILELYSAKKPLSTEVNIDSLSKLTVGFAGADLEALINEAALIAVVDDSEIIEQRHIDKAYYKVVTKGNPREVNRENSKELETVAYHEAGHAVVSKLLTERELHKVTIVPSTTGAGGITFSTPSESMLMSKKELLNTIKMLYAGRAAEEIYTGSDELITSGASSDIEQATNYLKAYFADYGMSEKYGMVKIKDEETYMKDMFELSKKLYSETLSFLKENKHHLDALSFALIEKETISAEEVEELMDLKKEIKF